MIEVHVLTHDHEPFLAWSLKHYGAFAHRIVVHDGGAPKGQESAEVAAATVANVRSGSHILCNHWEVRPWDTGGQLNDALARKLKNECWRGTDADWVIVVDADELIYCPQGVSWTLDVLGRRGAAMLRPEGFEMFSDALPKGTGQIYDEIKEGAPDSKWYSKPVVFRPSMIEDSGLGIGAHEARAVLKDGRSLKVDKGYPHPDPRVLLLHYRQIGPVEHVAALYDAQRKRLAKVNEDNGWGNFDPGLKHAQDKRAKIVPNLVQVVA